MVAAMRILIAINTLVAAFAALLPLVWLPDTQAAQIVGGLWGMCLGVCVLFIWGNLFLGYVEHRAS